MATLTVAKPAVATMKAVQISKPGAGFQIVEREIPEPVRTKPFNDARHAKALRVSGA